MTDSYRKTRFALPRWLLAAMVCASFPLSPAAVAWASADEGGRFAVLPVENPRYCGNELFRAFENYYSPRVRQLRDRYDLDAIVADEDDE